VDEIEIFLEQFRLRPFAAALRSHDDVFMHCGELASPNPLRAVWLWDGTRRLATIPE
jgi:hypothetical protein